MNETIFVPVKLIAKPLTALVFTGQPDTDIYPSSDRPESIGAEAEFAPPEWELRK